jgi:hypothetical protein
LPVTAVADECLHFDVPNFTLEGRLVRGERQAANGRKTNDGQNYRWYLKFTKPICVSGEGNDTVEGALQTELWARGGGSPLESVDGQIVRATGHFLPTYIPHYHVNLIFTAESLEVAAQAPPDKTLEQTRGR